MAITIAPVLLALFFFFILAAHAGNEKADEAGAGHAAAKADAGMDIGNCNDDRVLGYVADCDASCKKLKFEYGLCDFYCRCFKLQEVGENIGNCRDRTKPTYWPNCDAACKAFDHAFGVCGPVDCMCHPPNP